MPSFELTKWYADCVSENGEAAIVYNAELRWGSTRIHYNSLLTKRVGLPAEARYSMRNWPAPAVHGKHIEWAAPNWDATGIWREPGPSQRKVLFESHAGSLDWNGVAPRAAASMQIGSALKIDGWGYVEHLRLTLAPWKLPIRRLRWGRFVNATDALVWIDWSGPYNTKAVYLNGTEVNARKIDDCEVVIEESDAVLILDRKNVLRKGALGSTALKVIPNVEKLFQESILNMRECKWLSGAVLCRPGQADSVGMAIHEVVEWP